MYFLGVPQWLVTGPFLGGYPRHRQGGTPVPGRGVPHTAKCNAPRPGQDGVPPTRTGVSPQPGQDGVSPPIQVRMEYPQPGLGYPPDQDRMGYRPPPLNRTAEQALATWWAVCLLRSCRRTVLFNSHSSVQYVIGAIVTARVWSTREGNVFTLLVHRREGIGYTLPHPHPHPPACARHAVDRIRRGRYASCVSRRRTFLF